MGRQQRRALTILLIVAAPGSAGAAISAEVEVGSPFAGIAVTASIADRLELGGRAQLLDARALRVGPTLVVLGPKWGPLALSSELFVARSFGLSVISTFDAQLTGAIAWSLDERSTAIVELGALGYLGPTRTQTGLVGSARLIVETRVEPEWTVGFELGWLASPHEGRPQGGFTVRRSF